MSTVSSIVHRYDVDRRVAEAVLANSEGLPLGAELLSAYDILCMAELNLKQAIKACSEDAGLGDGSDIEFDVWTDAISYFISDVEV